MFAQVNPSARLVYLLLIFVCTVLIAADTFTDSVDPESGTYTISLETGSSTRYFTLIIPSGYDHSQPEPLLFCFHGANLSMAFVLNNRMDLIDRCNEENWLLVIPNGSNDSGNRGSSTWNAYHCCGIAYDNQVDDVAFVSAILDTLKSTLSVDIDRIYLMGGSNGGMLVHRLAAEMPETFAAAAAAAATAGGRTGPLSQEVRAEPQGPVPFILIHGMNDQSVAFEGGRTIRGLRYDISFQETVMLWVRNNQGSITQPDTVVFNGSKNNNSIWVLTFDNPDPAYEVQAIAVSGMAHGWPDSVNAGFDGTNTMCDFLERFSKNQLIPIR